MTRSSTSIGWHSRPSSYGLAVHRKSAKARLSSLASIHALVVFLVALVVSFGSGLVDTKARPGTSESAAVARSSLSALSCTFVARSPAGAYSFSAPKWQSIPRSPEADLEAVEADVDDVDASGHELVRHAHAHGEGHSPIRTSSRVRSVDVHRAAEARMASRFAAESCPPRGPPV